MPFGDGTGPAGKGPGTGRGAGRGAGRGRMGGTRLGTGPSGNCICRSCGTVVAHQRGKPCYDLVCPKCGANMVRH